jgi:hypothetical protein
MTYILPLLTFFTRITYKLWCFFKLNGWFVLIFRQLKFLIGDYIMVFSWNLMVVCFKFKAAKKIILMLIIFVWLIDLRCIIHLFLLWMSLLLDRCFKICITLLVFGNNFSLKWLFKKFWSRWYWKRCSFRRWRHFFHYNLGLLWFTHLLRLNTWWLVKLRRNMCLNRS